MTRTEILELLPFRANGTLEGADLAAVDAALAEDADLRAELDALMAIRDTMKAEPVQSPGEFGLARLMRDVEADLQSRQPDASTSVANDNAVPVWRLRIWQAAAVVVLAVGLGVNLLPDGFASGPADGAEPVGFSLASGETAADFTVVFAPDATEAEIRGLLLEAGLEIVSGPSALGLYGLGLVDAGTPDDAFAALSASAIVEDVQ